jgi:predicted transcriptional regulator
VRREILRLLHEAKEPRSPQQLSAAFNRKHGLPNIAYHVRTLDKWGLVTLVYEERVRAVQERFFASKVSSHERVLSILADTAEDDASVRK